MVTVILEDGSQATLTQDDYINEYFGGAYKYSNRNTDAGALVGFVLAFSVLQILSYRYVNMVKR